MSAENEMKQGLNLAQKLLHKASVSIDDTTQIFRSRKRELVHSTEGKLLLESLDKLEICLNNARAEISDAALQIEDALLCLPGS